MQAWCGRCGRQFALAAVLAPVPAGRCPHCCQPFAPSYDALLVDLVRDLLSDPTDRHARAALDALAPPLHLLAAG